MFSPRSSSITMPRTAVRMPSRTPAIRPSQPAEWLPARVVMLKEPNIETMFALLETRASNFLRPFSLAGAQREHRAYRSALEQAGVRVIDMRDALVGALSTDTQSRARLRGWAETSVRVETEAGMSPEDAAAARRSVAESLDSFDADMLTDLILLRPTIRLGVNAGELDPTTRFVARYEVSPANNSYYVRDPMITTARGTVIGRLRLDLRQPENDIAQYALAQLGVRPVYRVQGPGTLEGGDFIPCGDFVLQGQGLLTNEEGVRQCLENTVYGFVEVAVVRDPRGNMDEMHLDTYFSVLDRDLCSICEDRTRGLEQPMVDLYVPEGTPAAFRYRKSRTLPLMEFLAEKGMRVITFTKGEQEGFAPNGLLVGARHQLAVRGCGEGYARKLEAAGVKVTWLDFHCLTGGYGGPHCASQALVRAYS